MAARKAKDQNQGSKAGNGEQKTGSAEDGSAVPRQAPRARSRRRAKRAAPRPGTPAKKLGRGPGRPKPGGRKAKVARKASRKKASSRGTGKRYSDRERRNILETAKREGLTGAQVRARFGVSTLSFYTWRKKAGKGSGQGAKRGRSTTSFARSARPGGADFASILHREVQARISKALPAVIQSELARVLGGRGGRGGR